MNTKKILKNAVPPITSISIRWIISLPLSYCSRCFRLPFYRNTRKFSGIMLLKQQSSISSSDLHFISYSKWAVNEYRCFLDDRLKQNGHTFCRYSFEPEFSIHSTVSCNREIHSLEKILSLTLKFHLMQTLNHRWNKVFTAPLLST